MLFLLLSAPLALAQEIEKPSMQISDVISGGGSIGWMLIILSVIGLALFIDNMVNMRKQKLAPPDVVDEIEALIEAGEYQEAMELCEAEPNYFTNIVAAGLPRLNASFEAMEKSVEEMSEEEQLKLFMKLGWLSLIAAVAPMLGLTGTVLGMILAFKVISSSKGAAEPADLADNISLALITTLLGLFVAIPMTAAFVFLRNRVVKTTLEISAVVEDIFERFRPTKS
ncbi:MAG: MotA/TolQ/ExbB proton channel family protein [Planctomycetota bacterium]